MKWYEGPTDAGKAKHKYGGNTQVKEQRQNAVSQDNLKVLKHDLMTEVSTNKKKIEMQNFNFQGAKKQHDQLKRYNEAIINRDEDMKRGLGSRERSTGFHGVEYPNLTFNSDANPISPKPAIRQLSKEKSTTLRSEKRSFSNLKDKLYPRSLERNTSFTAKIDASCCQQRGLRNVTIENHYN